MGDHPIIVMKFGGTSVATPEGRSAIASRVTEALELGKAPVLVVSAMGRKGAPYATDTLLALVTGLPADAREHDLLASTGELISAVVVAHELRGAGIDACALTGAEAGIGTDGVYGNAAITDIYPAGLLETIALGRVPVVAGFQGVAADGRVTTLGRGGSDTTAVALAHALAADVCEIYTDVEGVYTANPSLVARARKIPVISYDEMLELAASGAQVLALRSVEYARKYGIPIHVRSSFSHTDGTWVREEDDTMESAIIRGVTYAADEAKVTVRSVPDRPGVAAYVFGALADANVNVDMIIQNVGEEGHSDISCTVPREDLVAAEQALRRVVEDLGAKGYTTDTTMAKVSVVGAGMRTNPGVAATMFKTLADIGVNLEMISTSPIKISCVIAEDRVEDAVRALHDAFGLDEEQLAVEKSDRAVGHD